MGNQHSVARAIARVAGDRTVSVTHPPGIISLPPELLLMILEQCDSFGDMLALALSNSRILQVWFTSRKSIVLRLAPRLILAYEENYASVREIAGLAGAPGRIELDESIMFIYTTNEIFLRTFLSWFEMQAAPQKLEIRRARQWKLPTYKPGKRFGLDRAIDTDVRLDMEEKTLIRATIHDLWMLQATKRDDLKARMAQLSLSQVRTCSEMVSLLKVYVLMTTRDWVGQALVNPIAPPVPSFLEDTYRIKKWNLYNTGSTEESVPLPLGHLQSVTFDELRAGEVPGIMRSFIRECAVGDGYVRAIR